jgi:hypothetical protein
MIYGVRKGGYMAGTAKKKNQDMQVVCSALFFRSETFRKKLVVLGLFCCLFPGDAVIKVWAIVHRRKTSTDSYEQ